MPFALLLIGAVILISAIRGTHAQLGSQVVKDFTGANSFLIWLAAIAAVGALGYSPVLRTPSRVLLALIILGVLISNQGFFAKFQQSLSAQPAPVAAPAGQDPPLTGSVPVTLQGGQTTAPGGGGGAAGTAASAASAFGSVAKGVASILPFF